MKMERIPVSSMERTIQSLIDTYPQTVKWVALAPNSRRSYDYAFDAISAEVGSMPVADIRRSTVLTLQQNLSRTPAKANVVIRVFSILMHYAVDLELRETNPACNIPCIAIGEWSEWPDHAIKAFTEHSLGMARRAFYLCLYTGQRIGDVVNMRWSDFAAGGRVIMVYQQKTKKMLAIPLHSTLIDEINRWPDISDYLIFHTRRNGQFDQFTQGLIYASMMEEVSRLDLNDLTVHGLRKNCAKMMAEAGCTERECQAITGHTSSKMIAYYTKGADQKRLAINAISKLEQASQVMAQKTLDNSAST